MGLQTVLGLRRRGFFIPYRYAGGLDRAVEAAGYPALVPGFDASRPAFADLLSRIDSLAPDLEAIGGAPPPEPRWQQHWFPRLDAAACYAMVRHRAPRRIVEIGSGHSTRFLARAVADGGLDTEIVTIDPAPRASLPADRVRNHPVLLHEAPQEIFAALRADDILFVDSSHILMPGTDVDRVLNHIWPGLAAGVVVHFHDIYLPDAYPAAWRWRGYNEQSGVAALIAGGAADILFSSRYAATRMADDVAAGIVGRLPHARGAASSSLWLVKRQGPIPRIGDNG